jgi:hypothetical protein
MPETREQVRCGYGVIDYDGNLRNIFKYRCEAEEFAKSFNRDEMLAPCKIVEMFRNK